MVSSTDLRRLALGVMAGLCLCGGAIAQAAAVRKHTHPAAHHPVAHRLAGRPRAVRPVPPPQTSLKPVPLLPEPESVVPFVFRPLPMVRPPIYSNPPQTYGGGGTVILPSGGSFGGPPIAGGSFGGGQRTGGSFGDGRVH